MNGIIVWRRLWLLLLLVFCVEAEGQWVQSQKSADVGYFLVDSMPPRLERFAFVDSRWLPPIILPAKYGFPTAFCVDEKGLYIAYGQTVRGYGLDGSNEVALLNAPDTVVGLFTDGDVLFANRSSSVFARFTSVNKTNGIVISTVENYIDALGGASIARSMHRLFGRSIGISPSDITYIDYTESGTFGAGGDSPYHGSYPGASKTWVFPGDAKVADSSGTVYSTESLTWVGSFGTQVSDLDFYGNDIPIVLSGSNLLSYTKSLLPSGNLALGYEPQTIYVNGTNVLTFTVDASASNGIRGDSIPISSLNPPLPNQAVNPKGLPYTPDGAFLGGDGILYLLSAAQQSIFRWDTVKQTYLGTIPLLGVPSYGTYSESNRAFYLAYSSGLVRKIDLSSNSFSEVPFVALPNRPIGLSVAGNYLFAADQTGPWETHYTFDASGSKISSKDWNYYSREYVWNDANQRMYFFRDDTSPNDVLWEQIDANGSLGSEIDSPLHDSTGFAHPIRVAPDGSIVVLGSGCIHDAITLQRSALALGNSVSDIAWCDGNLKTIRTISGVMQCQDWSQNNYGLNKVSQFPGSAQSLFSLGTNRLLAIASMDGIPSFYVLDGDFNVIAPASLDAPENLAVIAESTTQISLSWSDIAGESGYVIERKTGSNGMWAAIASTPVSSTNYIDATALLGNIYFYRVTATNGPLSAVSTSACSVAFTVPQAPEGLAAVAVSSDSIRLSWSDVSYATGYVLERQTGATSWSWIATLGSNVVAYTNSGLLPDTQYRFRITATNAIGSSSFSVPVGATTDAVLPATPALIGVMSTNFSQVRVVWQNVNYEQSYVLQRQTGQAGIWSTIAMTSVDSTSYVDTNVLPVTSYGYRVCATNRAGVSPFSAVVSVTTPQVPPPAKPQGLTIQSVSASSVSLGWKDQSDETGYYLQRRTENINSWATIAIFSSNSVSAMDTNVIRGVSYTYRLVAFNQYGDSPTSSEVGATPYDVVRLLEDRFDPAINDCVWRSIQGGIVTNGNGFDSANALWFGASGARSAACVPVNLYYGGTINFSIRSGDSLSESNTVWNASEGGENVLLEYATDGGPWTVLQTLNTVYPSGTNWANVSIALPSRVWGTEVEFRFRQLTHSGPGFDCWALDNFSIEGAAPPAPETPHFLIASSTSSSSISTWWTGVNGATFYSIERKTAGAAWASLARVSGLQTYFEDSSALPGTTYFYRVSSGNAGGQSGYSPVTTAATWSQQEQWVFENFGSTDAVTGSQMTEVSTNGPNLLLRYAFNLSAAETPRTLEPGISTNGTPKIWIDSARGRLCVEYVRRKACLNPGIDYQVQFSADLTAWSPCGAGTEVKSIDALWERVRYEEPLTSHAIPQFFRVVVQPIAK